MKNNAKLTDSEWKVMNALWEQSPKTLRQIIDAVYTETKWSKHTVISFLKRMEQKGSIRVEDASPARLYYAALDKGTAVGQETDHMLGKLYGGKPALLVSNMVEKLDPKDIKEMIALLQKAQKEHTDEHGD